MSVERKTVPCTRCGTPTPMLGTRLCDPCWERQRHVTEEEEALIKLGARVLEILRGYVPTDYPRHECPMCRRPSVSLAVLSEELHLKQVEDAARSLGLLGEEKPKS